MMDWEDLRYFSSLVRYRSLAAAARSLGVEHATVARRVASLERTLGLKLVDRRGRRLVVTADGERIAAVAERMESDAMAIRRLADGATMDISGEVTISAPPAFAASFLAEPLVALQREHPGIRVRLVNDARIASLDHREADVALRLSRPDEGDYTISRIGEVSFRLYASSRYLAATSHNEWQFVSYEAPLGDAPQNIHLKGIAGDRPVAFSSASIEMQRSLAAAGAGLALLPDFAVSPADGLVEVVYPRTPLRRDVWLVVHTDMRTAHAVRMVTDCLRDWFLRSCDEGSAHPRDRA